jgi:hypothetical protein
VNGVAVVDNAVVVVAVADDVVEDIGIVVVEPVQAAVVLVVLADVVVAVSHTSFETVEEEGAVGADVIEWL